MITRILGIVREPSFGGRLMRYVPVILMDGFLKGELGLLLESRR
jgi:hypothetical protein